MTLREDYRRLMSSEDRYFMHKPRLLTIVLMSCILLSLTFVLMATTNLLLTGNIGA